MALLNKFVVFRLQKAAIVLGGLLMNAPLGVSYYYGNLSTYIDSYYIASVGRENHTTGSLWVTSLWISFLTVGVMISGLLTHKLGPRLTLLVGMCIFNAGVLLSFFTIKHSFWSMHITLAVMTGIGSGFCFSLSLLYVSLWIETYVGLATSVMSSTLGGGSILLNLVITSFINPQNLPPDLSVAGSRYFSQDDLINRVPMIFLVIGAISVGLHCLAFPLMRNRPKQEEYISPAQSTGRAEVKEFNNHENHNSAHKLQLYGATESPASAIGNNSEKIRINKGDTTSMKSQLITDQAPKSLTPLQALKSKTFYMLAVSLAFITVGFNIETSSYKQFGVVYFQDDYYLANIGVAISAFVAISRIVWGFMMDKLNPNLVLVLASGIHTVFAIFWYLSPQLGPGFYLFWVMILLSVQGSSLIIYPIVLLKLFGNDHYVTIFGLTSSSGIIVHLITPVLAQVILQHYGWFWLFSMVAFTSCISLVLVTLIPKI